MPLDEFFREPQEFVVGQITDIRLEDREYGSRLVVEVQPIGETAPRLIFFSASTHRRSRWQRFLRDLRKIGVTASSEGDLRGKIIKFEILEEVFNIDGGEQRSDYWMPRKLYNSEAQALADMQAEEAAPKAAPTPASPAKPAGGNIPAEIVESARALFQNLDGNEAVFRLVANSTWPNVPVDQLLAAIR